MRKSNNGLDSLKRLREQALQEKASPAPQGKASLAPHGEANPSPRRPAGKAGGHEPGGHPERSGHGQAHRAGRPGPTPQDMRLLKQAMRSVTPLKKQGQTVVLPDPPQSSELLRQRRQWANGPDTAHAPAVSDHFLPAAPELDPTRFVRPGHSPDLIRNLKRSKWPIEASIDLHGCTLDQARTRLDQFLSSCLAHRIRCVQVIHGKGFGSRNGAPVLKEPVRRWLTQYDAVLAYIQCSEHDGGSGAVQVLLRPGATSREGAR
jgi:DNA-nicking Smr family endonuclease